MALTPCIHCYQPFYASCHDGACAGALCPYCEYAEADTAVLPARGRDPRCVRAVDGVAVDMGGRVSTMPFTPSRGGAGGGGEGCPT